MAKKLNAWMAHVADVRKQHPGMSLMEILKKAKSSYEKPASSSSSSSSHKKHSGGAGALGGALSPSDVAPGDTTSDANIQIQATTFSGGKKSKRRGSKRRGSKRSASKKSKRRGSKRH
jgi:hypothetical protein